MYFLCDKVEFSPVVSTRKYHPGQTTINNRVEDVLYKIYNLVMFQLKQSYFDVVEVDLHQVRVVALHSQQGLFYVSGVGLFIGDWFILGALDHTYNTFTVQSLIHGN